MGKNKSANIAILQPFIPHYREHFFKELKEIFDIDIYIYENKINDKISVNRVKSWKILNTFIIYSFFNFLKKEYKIIILPGELRSISTWFLLITKKIHKKKIILWGHGISINNYLKEEKKYPFIKRIFHKFADEVWVYTKKEKNILKQHLDKIPIIALNNTINSNDIKILDKDKTKLRKKYKIKTSFNFIYCARFVKVQRRMDLFLKVVEKLDPKKYGFIIIGDGPIKPDFGKYKNVYDFGAVYSREIKNELFAISDLYLQMGWIGLSGVEALLYGKPIITLRRSKDIKQCVEYNYIKNNYNGYIAESIEELIEYINSLSGNELTKLQKNAYLYAQKNLKIENMINIVKIRLKKLNEN